MGYFLIDWNKPVDLRQLSVAAILRYATEFPNMPSDGFLTIVASLSNRTITVKYEEPRTYRFSDLDTSCP